MFSLFILLLIIFGAGLVFFGNYQEHLPEPENTHQEPDPDWTFGDIWKRGSPDQPVPDDTTHYSEILRVDTGMGYDDSSLIDLVGYLNAQGIRATYDSVPLAMEFGMGAIKTYVLKVEPGKEEEAKQLLKNKK